MMLFRLLVVLVSTVLMVPPPLLLVRVLDSSSRSMVTATTMVARGGRHQSSHHTHNRNHDGAGGGKRRRTTTAEDGGSEEEGECEANFGQDDGSIPQCVDTDGGQQHQNDEDGQNQQQEQYPQQQHTRQPNRGTSSRQQSSQYASSSSRGRRRPGRGEQQQGRRRREYYDAIRSHAEEEEHDDGGEYYEACFDVLGSDECARRAAESESNGCILNFASMRDVCRRTCLQCQDDDEDLESARKINNLYSDDAQDISQPESVADKRALRDFFYYDVNVYMYDHVYVEDEFEAVRLSCRNRHADCTYWSWLGECEANPAYMLVHCAPACKSCENVLFENRCPFDPDTAEYIWSQPGDLNAMFQSIVDNPMWRDEYHATVHSQPYPSSPNILQGPWVVTLDDFVNETECQTLIELGMAKGYERSEDLAGEMNFDGTFEGIVSRDRTSTNTWCQEEECYQHKITQAVLHRIEQLTQIPEINFEHLQLLRYNVGEFYGRHHDYIRFHAERAGGPRIITVFLYLNNVTAGGGTNFPLLNNLTIMPRQGRVLLWPSVLDENPLKSDDRTEHQALPVEEGIKYAANAWVHSRDWKTPLEKNCH